MASFSDNFNRADSADIGSDWSVVEQSWSIESNQLKIGSRTASPSLVVTANFSFASLAQASQVVRVNVANQYVFVAPVVRASTTERTCYAFFYRSRNGDALVRKIVNGAVTDLANSGNSSVSQGQLLRIEISADNILRTFINGVLDSEYEDTNNPINLHGAGIAGEASNLNPAYLDDFFAEDLAAATIPILSLPGVTDITATSARPQVTLTY